MKLLMPMAVLLIPVTALAAPAVNYELSFDNATHHEARITVTYTDVGTEPLQLRMSRSSPGRYAIHEFAKNVYNVNVVDGAGNAMTFTRPNPYQWDVAGHDGTVSMTYTLYADHLDGTYSAVDLTHAHLNMPATLMWAKGYDDSHATLTFKPAADNWKVATQLMPTDQPYVFTSPNLQYLMDSPIELSDFSDRSWQVESNGELATIRLAIHHDGTEEDVDLYSEMAKKVIAEKIKIFGELPRFDNDTYTFIADYLPYADSDAMEHRNSTILASPTSLNEANFQGPLLSLSHEVFHAWNVERIRPQRLEPFDFEQANMTPSLWFAEGFTEYYCFIVVRRAGEMTVDEFAKAMAEYISVMVYAPGRNYASPQGMSMQAPFVDAATAVDPTNFDNTFISYYTYGADIAIALDLTLRSKFKDVTLDTMMRRVWELHGKTEQPYSGDDLRDALAHVTDDDGFAEDFFTRYIRGQELPDFSALLDNAGLTYRLANVGASSAGPVSFEFDGKAAIIQRNTIIGTPLYLAGLDRGDQVLAIDRLRINSQAQWDAALERYKPGDVATIHYIQREIERSAELTFDEDNTMELVTYESDERKLSRSQKAFRESWLGVDSDGG
ncbi:MAG TPA: M61 family peptidase [Gammaproteobacteria bacterium]|nr:M61 family peptidase [Gammaproteobacteria bacterium]HIK69052.1 M61 family peptidase [Pseudomonadales bacterium]